MREWSQAGTQVQVRTKVTRLSQTWGQLTARPQFDIYCVFTKADTRNSPYQLESKPKQKSTKPLLFERSG